MKHTRLTMVWLCLAATTLLAQGCAPKEAAWDGIFAADVKGLARTCVAPTASPPNGEPVLEQMEVSNEGGWCGILASHNGAPYDSYLLVNRPAHGAVFAHRVGNNTRIDYTPDAGYTGTDNFSVRLIPGNALVQAVVTVTR
jgi:hypothetical protein